MQEDNDSDSSIDVIPEPEPSTNDSWGLALPDGLPNELNNMISETISQSDDDTSTIDLNPRKKVSVSLNTYIQRLNEAQNTLESLKPKLDTLNAKGTAAMWHRDSKRRRVEAVKVIFNLLCILLWPFQQHYRYNATGQSQEYKVSYT